MMNKSSWNNFIETREEFRRITEELARSLPKLKTLQQKLAQNKYKVENPVLYNTALDNVKESDDIKLILVADNPGQKEQATENRRYLVGRAGKLAERFFSNNPDLGIDLRKNVIILNKTPIHSARTQELTTLKKEGGDSFRAALKESQKNMAYLLLEFQKALGVPVWITGFSEMKKNGIFETYTETLQKLYADNEELFEDVLLFHHFSWSRFTIDLKKQTHPGKSLAENLEKIGRAHREQILG